ncbi:MAG: tetratricopeptide repeat protein [Chitinophagaceae bacterium]
MVILVSKNQFFTLHIHPMLKRLFLGICLLFLCLTSFSQTSEEYFQQGREFENQFQEATALLKYQEALRINPNDAGALDRASILYSREGNRQKNLQTKSADYGQAKKYAALALKLNPNDVQANYAMAVALGQQAMISGAKEKVADAKEVKKYADLTIQLDPHFGRGWFVLGKWNQEMANLNFFEKAAARVLFGGMPEGSLDQAIVDYQKCQLIEPGFILNEYSLGKAYHEQGEDLKAITTLKKALSLRNACLDDAHYKDQCEKLLKDLQ